LDTRSGHAGKVQRKKGPPRQVSYNEVAIRKAATAAKSPDKETLKARLESALAEIAQLKEKHAPGPSRNGPRKGPEVLGLAPKAKLVCHKCGKQYATERSLKIHKKDCVGEEREKFECPLCGKRYLNRSSVNRHIKEKHEGLDSENSEFEISSDEEN
jgi:predicted RNA-binding Zn-ribbon protein involved in translation (DUF1610 family)